MRVNNISGDGTFTDVTIATGITPRGNGSAAGWFDADSDGDLDLFISSVGDYGIIFISTTVGILQNKQLREAFL